MIGYCGLPHLGGSLNASLRRWSVSWTWRSWVKFEGWASMKFMPGRVTHVSNGQPNGVKWYTRILCISLEWLGLGLDMMGDEGKRGRNKGQMVKSPGCHIIECMLFFFLEITRRVKEQMTVVSAKMCRTSSRLCSAQLHCGSFFPASGWSPRKIPWLF